MRLFLLTTIMFALTAATAMVWSRTDCVDGSGTMITENRETGSFHGVRSGGNVDVVLTQGAMTTVRLEAENNIAPLITTKVENGVLVIGVKEGTCYNTRKSVTVYVTTPDVTSLTISGAGDLTATNRITTGSLVLAVNGSGTMKLEIQTPNLVTAVNGSGDVDVTGQATASTLTVNGSGDLDAAGLKSDASTVTVAGSGDCKVNASRTLTVTVAGSGDVLYSGGAKVTRTVVGSGSVRQM